MHRAQGAATHRRVPLKVVLEHRSAALPRLSLGLRVGAGAEVRPVGGNDQIQIEITGLRPLGAVGGNHPIGAGGIGTRGAHDVLAQLRIGERIVDLRLVPRGFGLSGSDQERHLGADRAGCRIERVRRQRAAIHHGPERKPLRPAAVEHFTEPPHRQRVQVVEPAPGDAERREHPVGGGAGLLAGETAHLRAAHRDRLVEEAFRRRHPEQRAHLAAATRLAEHRDVVRVAAEIGDVVAHPLERRDDVEHAGVGVGVAFAARVAEIEEPEQVEPVIEMHEHDVAHPHQVLPVVDREAGRSADEAAAVQPHHHRPLAAVGERRRVDVQHQTVFALRLTAVEDEPLRHARVVELRCPQPDGVDVADAGPRLRLARRHEPAGAGGGRPVGNAAERIDALEEEPAHAAGGRLDDVAGPTRARTLRRRERGMQDHARGRER